MSIFKSENTWFKTIFLCPADVTAVIEMFLFNFFVMETIMIIENKN